MFTVGGHWPEPTLRPTPSVPAATWPIGGPDTVRGIHGTGAGNAYPAYIPIDRRGDEYESTSTANLAAQWAPCERVVMSVPATCRAVAPIPFRRQGRQLVGLVGTGADRVQAESPLRWWRHRHGHRCQRARYIYGMPERRPVMLVAAVCGETPTDVTRRGKRPPIGCAHFTPDPCAGTSR